MVERRIISNPVQKKQQVRGKSQKKRDLTIFERYDEVGKVSTLGDKCTFCRIVHTDINQ